jgi:hypothetical protein
VSDPSLSPGCASVRSLTERILAGSAEARTAPLMGFLLPTAHAVAKVHNRGLCLPAKFRLQGLITLLTVFSLRNPAGFLSRRRRSWDSPYEAFSTCQVAPRSRVR